MSRKRPTPAPPPRSRSRQSAPAAAPARWPIVAVGALAVACNLGALRGQLLFDDLSAIVENRLVRRFDVVGIFSTPSWWAGSSVAAYRPVTTLTFALDAWVGGVAPFGYHLVNVGLHAAVCVLLLVVLARVTRAPGLAAIAAALFAVHPVHTEAVASVVGRAELLAAALGLTAWWCALRPSGPALAGVVLAAAVLAKENAACVALLVPAADAIYGPDGASAWSVVRRGATRYLALAGGAVAALALRAAVVGHLGETPPFLDNLLPWLPWGSRLLTAVAVIGLYARRLVWPFGLSTDYSYPQIDAVHSPLDPAFLAGTLVVVGAAAVLLRGDRHARLAVALAALAFAPVSNLVVPIGTVMAERLLYLPSAGFCLLVATVTLRVPRPRLRDVLVAGIVVVWAAGTVARTRVWHDPAIFFATMVRTAPRSARAHRELAVFRSAHGEHDAALAELDESQRLYPDDPVTWFTRGNVLLRAARSDEAIRAYGEALRRKPDYAAAMLNLGNAYSARGDEAEAEEWFRRGMTVAPDDPDFATNLANSFLRRGRADEAERLWVDAIRRDPDALGARANYATFLLTNGRPVEAAEQYRAATGIAPDTVGLWMGLVAALHRAGRATEARSVLALTERRFPDEPAVRDMRAALERAGP